MSSSTNKSVFGLEVPTTTDLCDTLTKARNGYFQFIVVPLVHPRYKRDHLSSLESELRAVSLPATDNNIPADQSIFDGREIIPLEEYGHCDMDSTAHQKKKNIELSLRNTVTIIDLKSYRKSEKGIPNKDVMTCNDTIIEEEETSIYEQRIKDRDKMDEQNQNSISISKDRIGKVQFSMEINEEEEVLKKEANNNSNNNTNIVDKFPQNNLLRKLLPPRYDSPLTRSDLLLDSTVWSSSIIGKLSQSALSFDSPCERIRFNSELMYKEEVAWASHLGLTAI